MNSRSIVLYAAAVLFSPDIALADNHAVTPRGQVDPIVLGERLSLPQSSAIERVVDAQRRSLVPADETHPNVLNTRKVRVVYPLPVNP